MKKTRFKVGEKAIVSMPVTIKGIDKDNYTLTMVASTQDVDRHGDTIVQAGWSLDRFNENPVILNSHNYRDATEVIANATRTEIVGKGKRSRLEQDWKFAVEENPKAKVIFDLYAAGFLHASSVGFIPTKFATDKNGNEDWYTIEEAELLEVSAVSVPANAYALAKQKGLSLDDENGDPIVDIDEDEDPELDEEEDDATDEDTEAPVVETPEEKRMRLEKELAELNAAHPVAAPAEETTTQTRPNHMQLAAKAIHNIQADEKRKLLRAHAIIQSLLTGEGEMKTSDVRLRKQLRNRKVNQAIRSLIQAK